MKISTALKGAIVLAAGLALAGSVLSARAAGTAYEGFRIINEDGACSVDRTQTVRFVIDGDKVTGLAVHLGDATKDLTFKVTRDVPKDGSSFAGWFVKEFRDLAGFDGTPVTYEAYLIGAYAGLSPAVTADYGMAAELRKIAEDLGLPVPERTFVIYGAERSPIFEFFCYPAEPKKAL
ncbi:MAG: hypothetical protein ABFD52_08395 [Acidobacteriota bacterium]